MELTEFSKIKEQFNMASLDEKVKIYVSAQGLTHEQYRELLTMYPLTELRRLEEALS